MRDEGEESPDLLEPELELLELDFAEPETHRQILASCGVLSFRIWILDHPWKTTQRVPNRGTSIHRRAAAKMLTLVFERFFAPN